MATTQLFRRSARLSRPWPGLSLSKSENRPLPCLSGRRSLHVGASVGAIVQTTADSLSWAQSAGVPWYIIIPLLAAGVNFTFRLPLQYYARSLRAKRTELNPLVAAWSTRNIKHIKRTYPEIPDDLKRLRALGATEKSRRRIYQTWGTQRWKGLAPLLGMFPFAIISEALRRKCGAPLGWISYKIGLGNAEGLQGASSMFDESLTNGGLLWFTDLANMDPYFALPFLCSAILASNIWGMMTKEQLRALLSFSDSASSSSQVVMTRMQRVVRRLLLLVPVFPMLFADLPSAIFLYWSFSFSLTSFNERLLGRYFPEKAPTLKGDHMRRTERAYLVGRKQDA